MSVGSEQSGKPRPPRTQSNMAAKRESPAEEIRRLRRCINDLVSVLALPAIWCGGETSQIVRALLDVLPGMLRLDLVYVRLNDPGAEQPIEMVRVRRSQRAPALPREIGEAIDHNLGPYPQKWPSTARVCLGAEPISIVPLRLGLQGEIGVLVAGTQRADFPGQSERLLLSVAVNQAAIGLQEARHLSEQKRLTDELDRRVAQRTAELAAANQELKREIAERTLVEERLRREELARAELSRVARITSLGVLTASIAHEVNQPLTGIITNVGTCLRMLGNECPNIDGASEAARRAIRDGRRASDVITRLRLLFAKKGATTESVDLNEATREVIALSRSELQRRRVILRTELAGDLPVVTGDRVQLQQVILNLLLNASAAMSDVHDRPRQLSIRTERDGSNLVRVSVRDAGVGLDAQTVDRLFEAFYTTKHGGMGIGLSVSRSIVDSHNGRLWAAPNDGPGATFSFSIPCGPQAALGATQER